MSAQDAIISKDDGQNCTKFGSKLRESHEHKTVEGRVAGIESNIVWTHSSSILSTSEYWCLCHNVVDTSKLPYFVMNKTKLLFLLEIFSVYIDKLNYLYLLYRYWQLKLKVPSPY